MRLWRLARKPYARLDGEGARRFGGRWNPPGIAMVYGSEHLSLAVLEVTVHLELPLEEFPSDYLKIEIDLPRGVRIDRIGAVPSEPGEALQIGARWIAAGRTVALRVPSFVIAEECNLLLNPAHRDFRRVRIVRSAEFTLDARLNPP